MLTGSREGGNREARSLWGYRWLSNQTWTVRLYNVCHNITTVTWIIEMKFSSVKSPHSSGVANSEWNVTQTPNTLQDNMFGVLLATYMSLLHTQCYLEFRCHGKQNTVINHDHVFTEALLYCRKLPKVHGSKLHCIVESCPKFMVLNCTAL